MSAPRIAILGFVLEANRNAPVSDRDVFEETLYLDGRGIAAELEGDRKGLPSAVQGFCEEMDAHGAWTPVPILLAEAPPGGPADHVFFTNMIEAMDATLRQSDTVDGVYICEHGAGLSTEWDDADGAVFAMARDVVGPDVPIVATLDLHGHVTPRMNDTADVMVAYLTNPHVDGADRGREAAGIMHDMLAGMRTCSVLIRVPMISPSVSLLTAQGPYADLINFGQTLLAPPLINISILAGFAPADATTNGMSIVVAARADTDGGPAAAEAVARQLAERAWSDRQRYRAQLTSLDDAIDQAVAVSQNASLPGIILADVADNPGGGGRGNTTYLLRRLHEANARDVVIGMMIDPPLAAEAHGLGEGETFTAKFNRDEENPFSESYSVEVSVERLASGPFLGRRGIYAGRRVNLGLCALLKFDGLEVVVASHRQQCADPVFLERMGIDVSQVRTLVIKSRGHFRAGFDEFFPPEQIYEVDVPGLTTPVLTRLGLKRVPRPIYPLDPDMEWSPST
jgi:microcystin degradation protein MlrC